MSFLQTYTQAPTVINRKDLSIWEERPHLEPILFHPDFC